VPRRVAIVYNAPDFSRYDLRGEGEAVRGVLDAVAAVRDSLLEVGDTVRVLPLVPPWTDARERLAALDADLIFNLFEGFGGRPETEALVPELLEKMAMPYTGCPAEALRLALDKAGAKQALIAAGISTPAFRVLAPETLSEFHLRFPCIVKPAGEDASHGITADSLVKSLSALKRQVRVVTEAYGAALVEEFAGGREFNATVLGGTSCLVLPPSEIVYSLARGVPRILTYASKWDPKSPSYWGTQVVCPAGVSTREAEEISGTTRAAFELVVRRGYARVDMRRDRAGRLNVIEVNPNPDISPDAGAARQAAAAGMTYTGFIEKIAAMAQEKERYACQDTLDARR
jgi:D-alanine-D-alanine ligase